MINCAHSLSQLYRYIHNPTIRPGHKECLEEARHWHKFVVLPQQIEDQFAPARYAEDLRKHGLFRLPYDELVAQLGPFGCDPEITGFKDDDFMIVFARQADGILSGRIFVMHADRSMMGSGGIIRFIFMQSRARRSRS